MPTVQDLLTSLNDQQRKAVEHGTGPAIVLAGAGSGKTTVLTKRAAWLVSTQGVDRQAILLVTFTNKAAGEMKQRIRGYVQDAVPNVGTFHSFCAQLLRKHGQAAGLDPQYSIYDTNDQLSTLKLVFRDHDLDPKKLSYRSALSQISNAKNELLSPGEFAGIANGYIQEQVVDIYRWYQEKLQSANAVDFDDLLLVTVKLLEENPDLLTLYQNQFEHILVDEYQDTNKAQYQLTKLLASPQQNLFVVGDFSQSIYAWRGADYRNMLRLTSDFGTTAEYRLEQNYRSHQSILDAATQVIAANRLHPVLSLWTDRTEKIPLVLKGTRTDTEEASQVVRWIAKESLETPLHDMAILYRTNAQSRAFEEQLLAGSLPYQVVGGTKFYDRKEIKDILCYLRFLTNSSDIVSFERIQKIGKRKFAAFSKWQSDQVAEALNKLSPVDALTAILEVTKYTEKFDPQLPEDVSRLENIAELLRVAAKFETIPDFLENVALIQDGYMLAGATNSGKNGVQLMSLHAAKGLEFPIVFLVGMEEGLLPHVRSQASPEDLEEERRLCYVGITRAKEKLYFSFAHSRYSFGAATKNIPSRFLQEISPTLFSSDSTKLAQTDQGEERTIMSDEFLDQILSGDLDVDSFLE